MVIRALPTGDLSDLTPEPEGFTALLKFADGTADMDQDTALVDRIERAFAAPLSQRSAAHSGYESRSEKRAPSNPTWKHMMGTHGIAHLRLATESRIDPRMHNRFGAGPYHDIAVTHMAHHKLLQAAPQFESRGFQSRKRQ